jgi:hypothetical protein
VTASHLDPTQAFHDRSLPGRLKAEARRTFDALRAQTDVRIWVQPVVVIWGSSLPDVQTVHGVDYVPGPALADYLTARTVTIPRCSRSGSPCRAHPAREPDRFQAFP